MRDWAVVFFLAVGLLAHGQEIPPRGGQIRTPVQRNLPIAADAPPGDIARAGPFAFDLLEEELGRFSQTYEPRPAARVALVTASAAGVIGSVLVALIPTWQNWGLDDPDGDGTGSGLGAMGCGLGLLQAASLAALWNGIEPPQNTRVRARDAYASALDRIDPADREAAAAEYLRGLAERGRRRRALSVGTAAGVGALSVGAYYVGTSLIGENLNADNLGIGYAATVGTGVVIFALAARFKSWPEDLYDRYQAAR